MALCSLLTLTLLLAIAALSISANDLTRRINEGLVNGKYVTSRNGRPFAGYYGIPYAEPPTGPLRFQPPVPKTPWPGVRESLDQVNACPQIDEIVDSRVVFGDEDCLYLNVFTPKLSDDGDSELLPVMLFIHGGSYRSGSVNLYRPDILLDHDVVLVVINYRLGALGFLTTGDEHLPGNNGLKDQSLAIKWAKSNVKSFGGDPDAITLFGESAGAASVHMHMMSPLSKGLFRSGISQSGTALNFWNFNRCRAVAVDRSVQLAELLNCPVHDSYAMIECLRGHDAMEIVRKSATLIKWINDPIVLFKPVAEIEHDGAFLTRHPVHYVKSGQVARVPWMTGVTKDEGALQSSVVLSRAGAFQEFRRNFDVYAPGTVGYEEFVDDVDCLTSELKEEYFPDGINEASLQNITNLYTDAWMLSGCDASIRLQLASAACGPIYFYHFGYRGEHSLTQVIASPAMDFGVSHFDELFYLFPMAEVLLNSTLNGDDNRMADVLTRTWYNFAKYGNPTINREGETLCWPESSTIDALEYVDFECPDRVVEKKGLYMDRVNYWRPIVDEIFNNVE